MADDLYWHESEQGPKDDQPRKLDSQDLLTGIYFYEIEADSKGV